MILAEMRDAAYPGRLGDWEGPVAGYLPSPRAYNPWNHADWARFGENRKLPIYVAGLNGEDDALACLKALYDLGVPRGTWVAYDLEGRTDRTAVSRFGRMMRWAGYLVAVYGQVSTLFTNPLLDAWWTADWNGSAQLYDRPGVLASQYRSGADWDTSVVADSMADRLWR